MDLGCSRAVMGFVVARTTVESEVVSVLKDRRSTGPVLVSDQTPVDHGMESDEHNPRLSMRVDMMTWLTTEAESEQEHAAIGNRLYNCGTSVSLSGSFFCLYQI